MSDALLTSPSVCLSIRGPRKRSTPKSSRSNSLPTAWTVSSPRLRPQPTTPCGLNWTCWRPTTSACAAGWMGNVKRWRYELYLQYLTSFWSPNWMILTCGWRQKCVCTPEVKKNTLICVKAQAVVLTYVSSAGHVVWADECFQTVWKTVYYRWAEVGRG